MIVIGPGSLYTSLIPNFLVDGVAEASATSHALRVYVCNVANMRGETGGLDAADHVAALAEHGLAGAVDVVLVHEPCADASAVCDDGDGVEPVPAGDDVRARIEALGPQRRRRGPRRPGRPGPSFACGALPRPREGGRRRCRSPPR